MWKRLLPACALGLLLCACRPPAPKSVFVDPALETLVPPDTIFATGADLDAIRTTHVFQKYLNQVKLPQLEEFAKKTGIDPRKDLWQVLSCSNGKSGLFLARGKFSSGEEEPRINVEGVSRFGYKGFNLFGNEQSAVLFLNTSTAAAGRTADLRALIDQRNQSGQGFPPALRAKIATIGSNHQVWAAFTGGLQGLNLGFSESSNIGQLIQVFRGVDSGAVGIDLRTGVGLDAGLDCHTDRDAKRAHDAIRAVVGMGRLSTPDNRPDLLKLYDAIQVKQDQSRVAITAQIPSDLEDKFLDLWLKQR